MFELQMWDGRWHPIWRSHQDEIPIEAVPRLIRFLENRKNMEVFTPDTRYRVIFFKILLACCLNQWFKKASRGSTSRRLADDGPLSRCAQKWRRLPDCHRGDCFVAFLSTGNC